MFTGIIEGLGEVDLSLSLKKIWDVSCSHEAKIENPGKIIERAQVG